MAESLIRVKRLWRFSTGQTLLIASILLLMLLVVQSGSLISSPWSAAAVIVAAAVTALAVRYPGVSLVILFAAAGFPNLVVPIPGHAIRPVELALLLCVVVVILRRASIRLRLPHLLAILFALIALLAFVNAPQFVTEVNVSGANKDLYGYMLVIGAFFAGAFLASFVEDGASLLVFALLGNIPLYLIGLFQALHLHMPAVLAYLASNAGAFDLGRISGPSFGPAQFGLYLMNLFAIALACLTISPRRWVRILGVVFLALTSLEIAASGTRNAVIAVCIMIALATVITRRYKLIVPLVMVGLAAVILYRDKIIALFTHPDTGQASRPYLWSLAMNIIVAHPWIGAGFEGFSDYYSHLVVANAARLNSGGTSVHNQYLSLAVEGGVFWLLVAVLLLASISVTCWRAYQFAAPSQKVLFLAALLAVAGTAVASLFDVPIEQKDGAVVLFVLLGFAVGRAEVVRWGKRAYRSPAMRLAPVLASHATAYASVPGVRAASPTGIAGGLYPPTLPPRLHIPRATPALREPRIAAPQRMPVPQIPVAELQVAALSTHGAGRTILIRMLSWGVAIPVTVPAMILLAHYLGPTQFGEYSFTLPFLFVFALFAGFGSDQVIVRQLTHEPTARWGSTLGYTAGTRLLTTVLCAGIAAAVAFILPVSSEQRTLLLLASPLLLFSYRALGFRTIYEVGFRAEQRVTIPSVIETTDRIITAGLVLVIVFGHLSLVWAYVLLTYSDLPFFLALVVACRRRYGVRMRFDLPQARDLLRRGFPLLSYSVLSVIGTQFDVFVLMALSGSLSVGLYALALQLVNPFLTIISTYVSGLYPLLCSKMREGTASLAGVYADSARIMALALVPLTIFVWMYAGPIVVLLGGASFAPAAPALQLLMCVATITFFNRLATFTSMAAHLDRVIPFVTGTTAVINMAANVALIPHWQATGAGAAAVISELAELGIWTYLLIRHVHLYPPVQVTLRVLLGSLPALAFLTWQQHTSMLVTAPIACVLILMGYIATKAISLADVKSARHMLLTRQLVAQPSVDA